MTVRYYSSIAQPTTLANNVTGATTIIDVAATVGFPVSTPYTLALDYGTALEELVEVTNAAGTTLTVTRGVGGTSAQPHSVGSPVRHVSYSQDFADSRNHENSTVMVHGVDVVVGETEAQTLTNKTLTAPTINNGTWNNADINVARIDPSSVSSGSLLVTSHASQNAGVNTVEVSARDGGLRFAVDRDASLVMRHTDARPALNFVSDVSTSVGSTVAEVTDESSQVTLQVSNDGNITSFPKGIFNDGFVVEAGPTYGGYPIRYTNDAVDVLTIASDGSISTTGDISAGNFNNGNWTAWTPTWSATGGGFSLGNGTSAGFYAIFGSMVAVVGTLIRGTTTSFGTGDVRSDVPVTPHFAGAQYLMSAICYDAGANLPYATTAILFDAPGATVDFTTFKAGAAGRVSGSGAFPFAWAGNTNASIRFSGIYKRTV